MTGNDQVLDLSWTISCVWSEGIVKGRALNFIMSNHAINWIVQIKLRDISGLVEAFDIWVFPTDVIGLTRINLSRAIKKNNCSFCDWKAPYSQKFTF